MMSLAAAALCLLPAGPASGEERLTGLSRDLPARYLKSLAEYYRRHEPKDWKGVIELTEK